MASPSYTINGVQVSIAADAKILLRGRTFDHRDKIKSLGGVWEPATKTWALPPMTDVTWLRPPPPTTPPPSYPTILRRSRDGRCCSAASLTFDDACPQGPMVYVCCAHGRYKSSYAGT
jgi:hypothetical protein